MDLKDFIVTRLNELIPEYDVRPGTNIYDWFVNLHYLLLSSFINQMITINQGLNLNNYATMSEDTLDALASNFLVTRRTGNKSTGTITLWFAEAEAVNITVATQFVASNECIFYASNPISIPQATVTQNYNVERGLYYYSFEAIAAAEGETYNIPANSITSIEYGPANIYIVENEAFTAGAPRETNTDLYNRILLSLGLRDLVTKDSIYTILLEEFTQITQLVPIGFGEDEMRRDLKTTGPASGIHLGNMIDIYIKPTVLLDGVRELELTYSELQPYIDGGVPPPASDAFYYPTVYFTRTAVSSGIPYISDVPVIQPLSVYLLEGPASYPLNMIPGYGDGVYGGYTGVTSDLIGGGYNWGNQWDALLISYEPENRYSVDETACLVFNPLTVPLGSNVRIEYKYAGLVSEVSEYVLDDAHRVITCSTQVKHFIPITVDLTITGTKGINYDGVALQTALSNKVLAVLGNDGIEISDLVSICYENGMSKVDLPLEIKGTVYLPTGVIFVFRDLDLLKLWEDFVNYVGPKISTFSVGTISVPA